MLSLVVLLSAPTLLLAGQEPELNLQQVVKANTATIKAIRSIKVTMAISHNMPITENEKYSPEVRPTYTMDWYKDGNRERLRTNWVRGPRMPHNSDASDGPDGYKRLANYDPNSNSRPSESFDGTAIGEINKTPLGSQLAGTARAQSWMEFSGSTLEAYVAAHPESKLAATPATSRFGCYEITTLWEGTSKGGSDVMDVRIYVDPTVGYWIRRIEKGPWQKSQDPGDKGLYISEIKTFKDCGNGIFWPLRHHSTTRLPDRTDGIEMIIEHTLHSINQPLPEEDFVIRFPDWLRVTDHSSGQFFVWGPEDKPRLTFASQQEYLNWCNLRSSTGLPGAIKAIAGVLGLFALLWWLRNRRLSIQAARSLSLSQESPG